MALMQAAVCLGQSWEAAGYGHAETQRVLRACRGRARRGAAFARGATAGCERRLRPLE